MILDYRERRYYLVRLNDGMSPFWWVKGHDNHGVRYDSYLKYFKDNIDSLKISPPYNHIKTNSDSGKWDGAVSEIGYVQMLFSCRKCDVVKIENIFREILVHDDYFRYVELTKEICGQ